MRKATNLIIQFDFEFVLKNRYSCLVSAGIERQLNSICMVYITTNKREKLIHVIWIVIDGPRSRFACLGLRFF